MKALRRAYWLTLNYLTWLAFGAVGLLLNVSCALLLLVPARKRLGPGVREAIRRLFDLWLRWFHATRVLRVTWRGFDRPLAAGTVYIANHPSLLDATFLLARLPDAICIFKPALMRHPVIGPAAIMAGYAAGQSGVDLVRDVAERIRDGRSLLIFPEGTRTLPGTVLGELRPGFALIASRARAPVQLVTIRVSPDVAPKGRAWWKPPRELPAWIELTLDRRWAYDPLRSSATLTAEVDAHLRAQLTPVPE